jgi:hypothetical protein
VFSGTQELRLAGNWNTGTQETGTEHFGAIGRLGALLFSLARWFSIWRTCFLVGALAGALAGWRT